MRIKKGSAFALSLMSIIALSVLAVASTPEGAREATIAAIFPGAILGIVGVTTAYIGGNVADNGVKGRFYNAALDQGLPAAPVSGIGFSTKGGES